MQHTMHKGREGGVSSNKRALMFSHPTKPLIGGVLSTCVDIFLLGLQSTQQPFETVLVGVVVCLPTFQSPPMCRVRLISCTHSISQVKMALSTRTGYSTFGTPAGSLFNARSTS